MNTARLLKNAKLNYLPTSENNQYTFASTYALSIYPIDTVYSFIPKNACSSLRYSAAVANGFLSEISDIEWIHYNNQTFIATQREIALAKYTFVVLRCPYSRVASCFLDLIVSGVFDFKDSAGKKLSISFHDFLLIIQSQGRDQRDQHWRNQSDFLHYEKYDDYFSLESFSNAINSLDAHGFKVHDTRKALNHDLSNFNRIDGNFSRSKEVDIKKIKEKGNAPTYISMFGDEEIKLVNDIYNDDIYNDDIDLYKSHFGEKELLF